LPVRDERIGEDIADAIDRARACGLERVLVLLSVLCSTSRSRLVTVVDDRGCALCVIVQFVMLMRFGDA